MTLHQRQVRLTRSSRRDLRNIANHIRKSDAGAAERFVRDLVQKIHHLAQTGVEGSSRDFLPPGIRAFSYRDRCFYFVVDDGTLTILRVLAWCTGYNEHRVRPRRDRIVVRPRSAKMTTAISKDMNADEFLI